MASFMPWPLYLQRKSSLYRLDRRLGGPSGVEKNLLPLVGIEPQPVACCYTSCLSFFLRVISFKAIVEVLSLTDFDET
jgi:hypothetical protein